MFERTGTNWAQIAKLYAPNAHYNQYFGYAVAIHGDTILVGAPGEDNITGAAYVFTKLGTNWILQARLTAGDRRVRDGFGWSVSTDGASLLVGCSIHGEDAGIGYVFERTGDEWSETARLIPPKRRFYNQEILVSISGERAAVNHQESPRGVNLFHRKNGAWEIQQTLTADDPNLESGFGRSFSLKGSRLAVGSTGRSLNGTNLQDMVCVYQFDGNSWNKNQVLRPVIPATETSFGRKVALSESTVFVGSYGRSLRLSAYGVGYAFDSDVQPPIIHSIVAKPNILFPPNNKMRHVEVLVDATDDCGVRSCRITSITVANGPKARRGYWGKGDWKITGDLTALLRATPSRHTEDRIYTIHIECRDEANNIANSSVDVNVPHDRRKHDDWHKSDWKKHK